MHDVLMKDTNLSVFVSKKAAAIALLIISLIIGSILGEVHASEETIAAIQPEVNEAIVSPTLNLIGNVSMMEIGTLPFAVPKVKDLTLDSAMLSKLPVFEPVAEVDDSRYIPKITGVITSQYGWRRHPIKKRSIHHNGVDIAARIGDDVYAPAAGIVTFSGVRNGYGNVIEIDHGNGYSTLLAHHSKLLVAVGDIVEFGQVIALAGRTGRVTGPHVHLEIRKNGSLVNPFVYYAK